MSHWRNSTVKLSTSILQAIKVIDAEGMRAALVVDETDCLLGMVTDGDVRRCILKGINLAEPVSKIMNAKPIVASDSDSREQILSKLQALRIYHIPIVDNVGRVVGFETLERMLASKRRENFVIVMAGGMGTRLHPLTVDCPKPLLKIGNKPVLEILLDNFTKSGFHHFYFAVNYKAEMIKAYFGAGERWGVTIRYLEEDKRLGTAGALGLLNETPNDAFFVVNADVVTNIDFKCLLEYHHESKVDATMCIREHEQVIPYGVVERDTDTHHLLHIVEKPIRQFFVNAGIYILEPRVLTLLPTNTFCDMPDLLTKCVDANHRVATFPIREYWVDIGKHEDLQKAHHEYEKVF